MAAPNLGPGKKRYSVSLTQKNVEHFQALAKSLALPSTVMSSIFDLALVETAKTFQLLKDTGKLTISDLMKFTGQQLELIIDEEIKGGGKNEVLHKKRNTDPNK
jgi:hypothetical protein